MVDIFRLHHYSSEGEDILFGLYFLYTYMATILDFSFYSRLLLFWHLKKISMDFFSNL